MKREEISEKLVGIYAEVLGKELQTEDLTDGILEKYHIDSLIALKIIVKIEQIFDVVIDDDNVAIEMLDAIDKAVTFIQENSEE